MARRILSSAVRVFPRGCSGTIFQAFFGLFLLAYSLAPTDAVAQLAPPTLYFNIDTTQPPSCPEPQTELPVRWIRPAEDCLPPANACAIDVYLRTGSTESSLPTQVCTDDEDSATGDGDEVCSFTLSFEATVGTSGTAIDFEFTPASSVIVHEFFDSDPTSSAYKWAAVNFFDGPSIIQAASCIPVGRLTPTLVAGSGGEAQILMTIASEWVDASGKPRHFDEIVVPEPSGAWTLSIGLLWLLRLKRLRLGAVSRSWSSRSGRGGVASGGVTLLLFATMASAADYTNRDDFLGALGATAQLQDFEWIPLSTAGANAGHSAVPDGLVRRGVEFETDVGDISLLPSGPAYVGAFLVRDTGTAQGLVMSPGGAVSTLDSTTITFATPVRAGGLTVGDAMPGASSGAVVFLDRHGDELRRMAFPTSAEPLFTGFFGYRIRPGGRLIAQIRVEEVSTGPPHDNFFIDDVIYLDTEDAFADVVIDYDWGGSFLQTPPPVWDALRALEAEDDRRVRIGPAAGRHLIVEFKDNVLRMGTPNTPDLSIIQIDPDGQAVVRVSQNGTDFLEVDTFNGVDMAAIDLDDGYSNLVGEAPFYFVEIEYNGIGGPLLVDAVKAVGSGEGLPVDLDSDGIADDFDNCPGLFNPDQADGDADGADGIGDACDNCPLVANAGQEDLDGDDIGNACEPPVLRLRPIAVQANPIARASAAAGTCEGPGSTTLTRVEVALECGGRNLKRVVFGIVAPDEADPSTATFGTNSAGMGMCRPPPAGSTAGNAIGTDGPGCTLGTPELGETVDPAMSGAYRSADIAAVLRSDTLYVALEGDGTCSGHTGNDFLCCSEDLLSPSTEARVLGYYETDEIVDAACDYTGLSSLTVDGVAFAGLERATDEDDEPVNNMAYASQSLVQEVTLRIGPAAGEDPADTKRWDLCVEPSGGVDLHKITFGLGGRDVSGGLMSNSDFYLEGCETSIGDDYRTCAFGSIHSYTVDRAQSRTKGPLDAGFGTVEVTNALYGELYGAILTNGSEFSLTDGAPICLGTVFYDDGNPDAAIAPHWVFDGLAEVADPLSLTPDLYYDVNLNPILESPDATGDVTAYNVGSDIDGDGWVDDNENCPFVNNLDQADNGGFQTSEKNGVGDECECGDVDGNGEIESLSGNTSGDLQSLRELLLSVSDPLVSTNDQERRCSVDGDEDCDTGDLVRLYHRLNEDNEVGQTCKARVLVE